MSAPPFPIGARVRRLEDARLVRGGHHFVDDLRLPGMLQVAFARCSRGPARVTRLGLERARALPGVVAVFEASDLAVLGRPMPPGMQQPGVQARMPSPLAGEQVRFAGEAVAAVVADDLYHAVDAAEAVEAEYAPLAAVTDAEQALAAGAPLVHADVPGNLAGRLSPGFGDVEAAFAGAQVVLRERFHTARVASASIEPRGVVAQPGGEGGVALTLWASTQAPHGVRQAIAAALGLPVQAVRVITPDVGGGFGPKGRVYPEEVVLATLALHLGRPLRWQATRTEDLLTTGQGRGLTVEAELAARADGTLLGLRARLLQDCGAYLPAALIVPASSAQHLLGPYRLPAASIEILGVYTHTAPLSPVRGGGREQGIFVMERLLDHLARRLGQDPLELRERNALRPEEFPHHTGYPARGGGDVVYDSGDYPRCLERARALIGYDALRQAQPAERAAGRYRGVAITLFVESTGLAQERARVEVEADGAVTLAVGSPSTGQGHATTFAQVCAAQLGVPVERVRLVSGDTAAVGEGIGTFASRMAVMGGNATALAAREVRAKALALAAEALEAAPADLELVDGAARVRGSPERQVTLAALAARAADRDEGQRLAATATFAPAQATTFAGGAHAALVEVDVETGRVTVQRYVVVHDCGRLLNPTVVEGQVHGGVAHGLGTVLGEQMVYTAEGRLETDSFERYALPRAESVPRIEVEHQESPSPNNPLGIKGAGEGGTIGALATVVGAVEDALAPLRLELNALPLRFEELEQACARLRQPGAPAPAEPVGRRGRAREARR